ncbi:hypothetical protein AB3331_08680 [Streptococcus sp. H49]|uniref:hypothetical protein n=1 Tax=Streptococcus huangxiaojuni TaxID=3237239 RepID=UPI0034A1C40B
MRNWLIDKENIKYKAEQDRMVEYLASHYEGIEKVEFKNFTKNSVSGFYTSDAIVNNTYQITFYLAGIKGDISLDFRTEGFTNEYPESNNVDSDSDISIINIVYFKKGE